jgi:hypothetical protein
VGAAGMRSWCLHCGQETTHDAAGGGLGGVDVGMDAASDAAGAEAPGAAEG